MVSKGGFSKRAVKKQQRRAVKVVRQKTRKGYLSRGYMLSRMPPGFLPKERYLTMKISFPVLVPSVLVNNVDYFHINISSAFDHPASLLNRKFYGSDIMFQMYKYATIMTCKFRMTCLVPYGDSAPFMLMGKIQNESTADPYIDDYSDFYEAPYRTSQAIKVFGNYITKNLNSNNYIRGFYNAKKFWGKDIGDDPDYASTVSNNPNFQKFLGCYYSLPPGTATASTAATFMYTATAIIKWWGPQSVDND